MPQAPRSRKRVSIKEAAETHGVSTKSVRRWIAAGLLPGYRVGPKLIRVDPDDVAALARRVPSATQQAV